MMITIEQIRAARAMLGLKQHELAKKADISVGTLNNIERGVQTDPKLSTMRAIQHALEVLGIEFIEEENSSVGIRLKTPRTNKTSTILIIDDSVAERKLYKAWLNQGKTKDYQILEAGNAKEGYEGFIKYKPDCIILDFMMYGKDGFKLLVEMKSEHAVIPPIIFVTAMQSEMIKKDAIAMGVHSFLNKQNLTKERLCQAVADALS
jgi:CheY-like chemotaxis protein/DNA-binding Xre family transcriptional regulator